LRDAGKEIQNVFHTIFEFYDKSRKHFAKEFMPLLTGIISNEEKAKKMDGHNKDDRLFSISNSTAPFNLANTKFFMTLLKIAKRRPKPSSEHVKWKFKK
jgi:hypothetical protein